MRLPELSPSPRSTSSPHHSADGSLDEEIDNPLDDDSAGLQLRLPMQDGDSESLNQTPYIVRPPTTATPPPDSPSSDGRHAPSSHPPSRRRPLAIPSESPHSTNFGPCTPIIIRPLPRSPHVVEPANDASEDVDAAPRGRGRSPLPARSRSPFDAPFVVRHLPSRSRPSRSRTPSRCPGDIISSSFAPTGGRGSPDHAHGWAQTGLPANVRSGSVHRHVCRSRSRSTSPSKSRAARRRSHSCAPPTLLTYSYRNKLTYVRAGKTHQARGPFFSSLSRSSRTEVLNADRHLLRGVPRAPSPTWHWHWQDALAYALEAFPALSALPPDAHTRIALLIRPRSAGGGGALGDSESTLVGVAPSAWGEVVRELEKYEVVHVQVDEGPGDAPPKYPVVVGGGEPSGEGRGKGGEVWRWVRRLVCAAY